MESILDDIPIKGVLCMNEQIVIKRYSNRKLYDTSKSCYVTLEEVADDIINNLDIIVIDNKTKQDITVKTLSKYAFEKILHGIETDGEYVNPNTMKQFLKDLNTNKLEDILKKVA